VVGLIGPDDTRVISCSLEGRLCFLVAAMFDFHIPKERVLQSAEFLAAHSGDVTTRLYHDGNIRNRDELRS